MPLTTPSRSILLNFLHILDDGFLASLPLLLPFIQIELGLNLSQVGLLTSTLNALGVVLALPAGAIAAKYGGMRTLLIAMAIYSAGFLFTATAPSYFILIIAFLLAGFGFGIFHPVAFAEVARTADKSSRASAMGEFTAIGDLGKIGLSTVVTAVAAYLGWRLTSAVYGFIGLIIFFLLWKLVRQNHPAPIINKNRPIKLSTLIKHPSFIIISLVGALDNFASASLFVFIPFLLLEKGVAINAIGVFSAFYFLGNMAGRIVLGRSADRRGGLRIFVISEILMAIAVVIFALAESWLVMVLTAVILGLLTKGTSPVIKAMVADAIDDERLFDQAFAMNSLITATASALAPFVFGLIANRFGIEYVFFASAGVALLAVGVTSICLPRPNHS